MAREVRTTISPAAHPRPALPVEIAALRRAFELALRGPGRDPNPQVGAVLLDPAGRVLAEGWHRGAGTPHAEVAALTAAAGAGLDVRGGTAVVSLEPCNHTGRTGPCSEALLAAGVSRVVYSVPDPSPTAAGGAARLAGAGVEVIGGVLLDEGRALLQAWLTRSALGRPFVTLKLASTLDGRVAAADGTSRWITSAQSRRHAHDVRAQVDAIVVGTGTALLDDPTLTARDDAGALVANQPIRAVVGLRDLTTGAAVRGPGGPLVQLRTHDPVQALAELAAQGARHVLVEGGPTVSAAFLQTGLVDEVHAYVAPVLLGSGAPAVGDLGITTIDDALRLSVVRIVRLGPDLLVVATRTED
jgi:diaminohydroxyphosphoribosylaminopyrimidine deaminase/5-amino-6-(5-phosphoribosylamino)uracil reductase